MIRSIRKAITGLVEKLTISIAKTSVNSDEREPAATKKLTVQPTNVTALNSNTEVVKPSMSVPDSFLENQSYYEHTEQESALAYGTQNHSTPAHTFIHSDPSSATVAQRSNVALQRQEYEQEVSGSAVVDMPTVDCAELNDSALIVDEHPITNAAANVEHVRIEDSNALENVDTGGLDLSPDTKEYEKFLDELNADENNSIRYWDNAT